MPKTVPHETTRTWHALRATDAGSRLLSTNVEDAEFSIGAKIDAGGLLVIKVWTKNGWTCDLIFLDTETGLPVASARAETESAAWATCVSQARSHGYQV
jgi:hypothetical protein